VLAVPVSFEVVGGLDLGVGHRVLGDVVARQCIDDDRLTCAVHRFAHFRLLVPALLDGFLHQHFAGDQVVLDGFAQLRRVLALVLGNDLLDDGVGACRRNRLAVDHCDVLGKGRGRCDGNEG